VSEEPTVSRDHAQTAGVALDGWRPIETAALDGTTLDLWGVTPLSGTTYESFGRTYARPVGERRTDIKWCTVHKCWRVAKDTHFVHELYNFTPTHWMPLRGPSTASTKPA
jgi:hypothetical protein